MPNTTTEIVGYVVKHNADASSRTPYYVDYDGRGHHFVTFTLPRPISLADAHRRLAGFIDENDESPEEYDGYYVTAVFRELTPVESGARELGGLLSSLCKRHGINLGLSQAEIEAKLADELKQLGAR